MNDELIDGLRCCAESTNVIDECAFEDCPYHSHSWACLDDMLRDAADAIEKLIAEIDHKDKVIKDMLTTLTGMKDKLIERICENCETPPEIRLRVCGECPIISPIREVFDEQ